MDADTRRKINGSELSGLIRLYPIYKGGLVWRVKIVIGDDERYFGMFLLP